MGLMADVRQGAYAKLLEVKAAHPTLLGEVSKARPASLTLGLPHAYVGDFRGNLAYTNKLRQWTNAEQDVVLVFPTLDNAEQQDAADVLTGYVLDAFSADHHWANDNMTGEPVRTRTAAELDVNGQSYPAVVVTLGRITYLEGGY